VNDFSYFFVLKPFFAPGMMGEISISRIGELCDFVSVEFVVT